MILWRLPDFVCQKMMLPATRSSCLKYIHTNISIYVGTGTWYIDILNDLYPKTSAGNRRHIATSATFVAQTRRYLKKPPLVAFLWNFYLIRNIIIQAYTSFANSAVFIIIYFDCSTFIGYARLHRNNLPYVKQKKTFGDFFLVKTAV
jgi:hypothetical protein